MAQVLRVPLILDPQPEGGYTVTSPVLPELITEGDTVEHALENVEEGTGPMRRGHPEFSHGNVTASKAF